MSNLLPLSKRRWGRIRSLHAKKVRNESGLTLMEGERLVEEALQTGVAIDTAVGTADFWERRSDLIHRLAAAGVETFIASLRQMENLSCTEESAGLLAVIHRTVWQAEVLWAKAQEPNFLGCLAVGLQDPGNVGTLIRALIAAGGSAAWLSAGTAEASSPKTVRASAGMVFRVPLAEQVDPLAVIKRCQGLGIQTLAAVPHAGRAYTTYDLTCPTLVVLGEEGQGLQSNLVEACQWSASIPMATGVESLNVAAAGAVLFFEAARQRRLRVAMKRVPHTHPTKP